MDWNGVISDDRVKSINNSYLVKPLDNINVQK